MKVASSFLLTCLPTVLPACSSEPGQTGPAPQARPPTAAAAAQQPREAIAPELKPYYAAIQSGQLEPTREALGKLPLPWNREGERSFLLAYSYYEEKLPQEALKHFARAIELSPNFLPSYYYQGMCALDAGDLATAARAFDRYLEFKPDHPSALFGRALVALENDELILARKHLSRAIELAELRLKVESQRQDAGNDLGRYLARYSDLCVRENKPEDARAALERAVTLVPEYPEVWSKLAKVARDAGDEARAKTAEARAQELLAARGR